MDVATRHTLYMLAVSVAVLALYADTAFGLFDLWSYYNYRHSYLIPVVSAFILWRERSQLADAPWQGSGFGLAALALATIVWLVGRFALVQVIEHVALVMILNSALLALAGWRAYRRFAFPFLYLLLAVPNGDTLIPVLMEATAEISLAGLHLTNIPVYREGMLFFLTGGTFEVATVCSGLNYLNTGLALNAVLAWYLFKRPLHQCLFLLVTIAVMVFANGLRAGLTMAIGSATQMRHMAGDDHLVLGWIVFALAAWLLFLAGERVARLVNPTPADAHAV